MFFSVIRLLLISTAILVVTQSGSAATIKTYSTASSWQAATSGDQTITFEGLTPAGQFTTYPGGISSNSVQFIGLSGSTMGVLDTSAISWANFGTGDAGSSVATTPSFRIILPANVTAIAMNLFSSQPSSFTVVACGTTVTVPTYTKPTLSFLGITSDTPMAAVDLTLQTSSTSYAFFDNVQFGSAMTQTPEAGTFALIGSGLVALALVRRRSFRRSGR